MAEYRLYCFGESGNCYKAALMLQLSRMDWEQIHVDYFDGETRSEEYRGKVNEMAEAPVLLHGPVRLSQSGVILDYLAERAANSGRKARMSGARSCGGSCSTITNSPAMRRRCASC